MGDGNLYDCGVCGQYVISGSLLAAWGTNGSGFNMDDATQGALTHFVRINWDLHQKPVFIATDWLKRFFTNVRVLTPPEIATNAVRLIGDESSRTGKSVDLPISFFAKVGAISPSQAYSVCLEMLDKGLLKVADPKRARDVSDFKRSALTFEGWERYLAEKRGAFDGKYGFVALKFGDAVLDSLLRDHVKPAIQTQLAFDLVDMRDVTKAGIIDNLLREKIRDSKFVLVDLTHENSGAYWEAGYAEGLGKPVLYICERAKFEATKTHFDTNHLTTVLWDFSKPDEFVADLIATLRRSLDLFPTRQAS